MEKMKFRLNRKLSDSWSVMLPKADISFTLVFKVFMNFEILTYSVFPVLLFNYHILEIKYMLELNNFSSKILRMLSSIIKNLP